MRRIEATKKGLTEKDIVDHVKKAFDASLPPINTAEEARALVSENRAYKIGGHQMSLLITGRQGALDHIDWVLERGFSPALAVADIFVYENNQWIPVWKTGQDTE